MNYDSPLQKPTPDKMRGVAAAAMARAGSAVRRLNPALFSGPARIAAEQIAAAPISKAARGMNKLEADFQAWLHRNPDLFTHISDHDAITLKLGEACRYTPDFWTHGAGGITAWEVKGWWREDARCKIKVAAKQYSWLAVFMAARREKGRWIFEQIAS